MKLSTMKSVGALALVLLVSSMVVGQAIAGWEMTWHDEFDGTRLDGSKWDIESNCWGGGNNEQQCYTNRASNVYVSNGALHLKPIAGTYRGTDAGCTSNNADSCTWTQPATSGRVRTKNAVDGSWKYGRFEVRAKLPKGDFLWPAIWMLPTDNVYGTWAGSGEIDIMESRGQNPSKVSSALHYGGQYPNNRHVGTGDINFPGVDFTAGYHVFACEWDAKEIKMYVDNRLTWTQTLKRSFGTMYSSDGKPFDQKFHMLLNVAVAGGFFNTATYGTFNIDRAGPTWTSPMQIDYVRVYKWTDAPAPVPHAPAPTPIAPTPVHTPVTPPTTGGQCGSVVFPLYPVHDTYSEQLRPGTPFGRDTTLKLRGVAPNQPGVAYLKFNLPKDRTPTRAMLSLYGSLEEPIDGSKSVFIRGPIDNDWSQDTLTHDKRPAITCTNCPSVSIHVDNDIGWYTWDVLPIITKAIQAGKDVVSFSVALSYSGHVTFNSNDAATNKPVLNLSY